MTYEYSTTTASAHPLGGDQDVTPPKPPEGDGWELVASSANERTRFHDWRRALEMTPEAMVARAKK